MAFRTGKDPVQLTASGVTAYTVPASRRPTLIEIVFLNLDTVDRTPTVYMVPAGQTSQAKYEVIGGADAVIKAGGESQIYRFRQFLNPSDFIEWKADAANVVNAWMGIVEENEDANLYRNVNADFLGAALASLRVVGTSRQATLIEVVLHNTDTVDRLATVHFIPSGGAAANTNQIIGGSVTGEGKIAAGQTLIRSYNLHRGAGVDIQAKADVASKIVAKLSLLEEVA